MKWSFRTPASRILAAALAVCIVMPASGGASGGTPLPGADIADYGGPVLANVEVTKVIWGTGVSTPIIGDGAGTMGGFFRAILASKYMDTLAFYNTTKPPADTAQSIGQGLYMGTVAIAPANTSTKLTDADIQAELNAQIAAGHLPQPNANTYFALFFPPSITIDSYGDSSFVSCVNFCAEHGTGVAGGMTYSYGVHPDLGHNGCQTGCGSAPSVFANSTAFASETLVDAVTDPDIGLASTLAPPLAWYDGTNGYEAGSACDQVTDTITAADGITTYTVNQIYLKRPPAAAQCVTTAFQATDFTFSAAPAVLKVARARSVASVLKFVPTAGAPIKLTLAVSGLPAGMTHAFLPAGSLDSRHSTLVLTASSKTLPGTYAVIVSAKGGTAVHTIPLLVTVK